MWKLTIDIWAPRYSRKDVLVAERKIFNWPNYIRITRDQSYKGKLLVIHGEEASKYPRQQNGGINVICIPLTEFEMIDEFPVAHNE